MRWLSLKEASELLKINKNTLSSKGRRGQWHRKGSLYAVPESAVEATKYSCLHDGAPLWYEGESSRAHPIVDEVFAGRTAEEGINAAKEDGRLFGDDDQGDIVEANPAPYKVIGGKYIFNLPSKPRGPFVMDAGDVEMLVAGYSNDGGKGSVNQLARKMSMARKTIQEVLKALGKTHDSLPYTDEQIASTSENELIDDLVRRKEEKVLIESQRKDWKKKTALAERAYEWNHYIRECLSSVDLKNLATPTVPYKPKPKGDEGFTVVSHATDLHYGKMGWVDQIGEPFNREVCRNRLIASTHQLMDRISRFGMPKELVIAVGGDWFHIDNHRQQTTKGTPQDADGTFMQIFIEGCALAKDHIEIWRSLVPKVRVVQVRGNHDYMSTAFLVHWLQAHYAGAKDVTVSSCTQDRYYEKIGNTILGLTHGDSVNDSNLVSLMAHEAKDMWSDTKYRLWLTGHWHSQITTEKHGVLVEHLPSLAGTDAWHKKHGYVGNRKGLMAHIIDHKQGVIAKLLAEPSL